MKLIGLDCAPVRCPLRNLTELQENDLHSALQEIGFFDYACSPAPESLLTPDP